ncbi:hypothetical protein FAM09_12305 [Niastella caeni]|uniref:Lipoprotein n=1 Tax=Niastella caeni TaxID=2569763 RepID=A0A4S8HUH4_9BACT|nr:hypothetical protein [Niastella caeni]THU39288.1 hypothetical protein FAM09_12305 [Niastella caeni]
MKRMMNLTVAASLAALLFMTGCGNSEQEVTQTENASAAENTTEKKLEPIIDLKLIGSKTLAEVEAVLGKAESTEKVKGFPCEQSDCQRAFFKNGQFEVIFKSGSADRITINNTPDLTDNDDAIQTLGLPASKPTFKNGKIVTRWNNVENINEINFFPSYVLIQITKPD